MDAYLAIDLGTTGCRSIVFDASLQILGTSYEEYGLITPKENWVEQDAQLWWTLTKQTMVAALEKAGVSGKCVRGISISSQGITLVPVDEDLTPLCNAISWLDARTEEETQRIIREQGNEEMFVHTGKPVKAAYTLTKLLWLKEHQPEIWEKTWKFLMPMDFLIGKLTGNCVTDHSMASGTLLYDIKNCCWSKKLLEDYEIPEEKLPSILWSGASAGKLLPQVAEELGLSKDCVAAVGAQDQKCAACGAGLQDGTMTISLGTAGAITKRWNAPETETHNQVGWCGYVQPGTWVTEGVISTAGTCLRWVRDLLFAGEGYDVINGEAEDAINRGSSLLFYPYLSGGTAPGLAGNATGNFYGVSLATKRGDFAAAVMEGVAFQIRTLLTAMDAYGNVEKLVLFGGGAKSPLWCQLIADITGMEILVPSTEEAASAGAAILAAKAAGKDLPCLTYEKSYTPTERKGAYEEKYQLYRSLEYKLWGNT